jgi:hypothetical protein
MNQRSILLALILLASCGKMNKDNIVHETDIVLVQDTTDTLLCLPEPGAILALFGFDVDKNQAASFTYSLITDKRNNPSETINIRDGKTTDKHNEDDDEDYREKLVLAYYDAVRDAVRNFQSVYQSGKSLDHSECFATIANELEGLVQKNGARRSLIVFSDLSENSRDFSCYSGKGKRLLQSSPMKVAELLLKHHPLPKDLRGISVYFVFNPRNREEDFRFGRMANMYRQLLQTRGARVTIQCQNSNFQP